MCRLSVLWIESFVRYFSDIVGILRFCDFMIFSSRRNTLILPSCTLVFRIVKDDFLSVDVGIIG